VVASEASTSGTPTRGAYLPVNRDARAGEHTLLVE